MTRPIYVAATLAALLLPLIGSAALGHAELVSASPGPDETVTAPPTELVAEFNQDLNESRTSLEVRDEAGDRIARGGELGDNPRQFRLQLPPLEPGIYEVRYASFSSEDGELHRDRFSFTVVALPSPTATASPTSAATIRPSQSPATSPSLTPSPSQATPSPAASADPGSPPRATGDLSAVLPILAVLAVVSVLGFWLFRRQRRSV